MMPDNWLALLQVVVNIIAVWVAISRFEKRREEKVNALAIDIAVIKTQILSALNLAHDHKRDHDHIISIQSRVEKTEKDLDAIHAEFRDFKGQVSVVLKN